jgi:hypothetical protein
VIEVTAARRERVAAGVVLGGAVLFVAFALPRVGTAGLLGALTLPAVALAADLVLAAALLTGWYPIRPVAQGLAVFGLLLHLMVALRGGPVWGRGLSALLAVAHVWALVLLFLLTAREQEEDEEDGAGAGPDEDTGAGPDEDAGADAREWADEAVETPVSDVVEVTPAWERRAETEEHAR